MSSAVKGYTAEEEEKERKHSLLGAIRFIVRSIFRDIFTAAREPVILSLSPPPPSSSHNNNRRTFLLFDLFFFIFLLFVLYPSSNIKNNMQYFYGRYDRFRFACQCLPFSRNVYRSDHVSRYSSAPANDGVLLRGTLS